MEKRKIAGRTVKAIGLGVMALDEYKPKAEEKDAIELLKHAVKLEVDFFDTADVYGLGRNEELIGKALNEKDKEKILIATKAGCTRPGGINWDTDGRPEHIKEAIKGSLNRLKLKQIELYQLHAPDRKIPLKESIKALKELQENGLIKNIGVSNFDLHQLKEAQKIVNVVSVQNHFNLDYKRDEEDLLPYLIENNIAFIPYFPLGSGRLLTNEKLIEIANELKISVSQLALAWIINKWKNTIPIPGTKNKKHLEENIKALEIKLEENIIKKIDSLY